MFAFPDPRPDLDALVQVQSNSNLVLRSYLTHLFIAYRNYTARKKQEANNTIKKDIIAHALHSNPVVELLEATVSLIYVGALPSSKHVKSARLNNAFVRFLNYAIYFNVT